MAKTPQFFPKLMTQEEINYTDKLHKKWYKYKHIFIHVCGKLGENKYLVGQVSEQECTCCGEPAPEQVLMLQQLQKLNHVISD